MLSRLWIVSSEKQIAANSLHRRDDCLLLVESGRMVGPGYYCQGNPAFPYRLEEQVLSPFQSSQVGQEEPHESTLLVLRIVSILMSPNCFVVYLSNGS